MPRCKSLKTLRYERRNNEAVLSSQLEEKLQIMTGFRMIPRMPKKRFSRELKRKSAEHEARKRNVGYVRIDLSGG